MTRLAEATTAMNDDPGNPSPALPAGDGDLPGKADRYVNGSGRPVDELVQFGGGLVAQRGTRPAAQDSGPQHRHPGRRAREGGIHTAIERLPAAGVQLRVSDPTAKAGLGNLPAGYDAVLEVE